MAELVGDTVVKNGSSESREMPLIRVPMQNSPCDLIPPEFWRQISISIVNISLHRNLSRVHLLKPRKIFAEVFSILDKNSLRQARLVCRTWNDVALQIMSKTPGRVKFNFEGGNGIDAEGIEIIKKLQSILRLTKYPEMFFTELVLTGDVIVGSNQLVNFFQKFGSALKSLHIGHIALKLPMLLCMLGNWFKNLEELCINALDVREVKNKKLKPSPTQLKLKLRKIQVYDTTQPHSGRNLIASIVKISPNLQVLHVSLRHGQTYFWKKLQNLPEVTENLKEVKIEIYGESATNLISIRNVHFSYRLTSLRLTIRDSIFSNDELVRLLKKVGESLEKLFLKLCVNTPDEGQLSHSTIELPFMKNLKVLEVFTFYRNMIFDSIDFLKKLPNLKILRLSCSIGRDCTIRSEFVDTLFSYASYLPMHPHTTLNTLSIKGSPNNPETILAINRIFPNLRDLTLAIDSREIPEITKATWLTRICIGFSEIENLKILHLFFPGSFMYSESINFEACLTPLTASESLEEITISHVRATFATDFPTGIGKVFVEIPRLKVLKISNFYLEIQQWRDLFKPLDNKGILLKTEKEHWY